MRKNQDYHLYAMLFATLFLPIAVGIYMQNFASWRYVSMPLHSFLEASGAMAALFISIFIFIMHKNDFTLTHHHYASFGLIAMGVFDAFHASVIVGETFVWLHSLAVFFGGIFFNFVWLKEAKVSKKRYFLLPFSFFAFAFGIAFISIIFPQMIPSMLNKQGEFTQIANLLNILGGSMFILASFYFIKNYLKEYDTDSLLFAGHTMLLGTSGVLFFFSNIWDMQWWFWHILRFLAYSIALAYTLKNFHKSIEELSSANQKFLIQNQALNESNKLLYEYKKAIFEASIISASDLSGKVTYVNEELEKISGYNKDELVGKAHNILRSQNMPKETFKEMWETIKNKKVWKGLVENRAKDGKSFCTKTTIIPILDTNDNILEYLALREDVTELINSQKELKNNFVTDRLTHLGNRYKLFEDLKKSSFAKIAIVNIDNFKHINDFYGDNFGDKVLIEVAKNLQKITYGFGYTLYRNHADEFSIISFLSRESSQKFIQNIKNILLFIQNSKFYVDEEELNITFSAGIDTEHTDLQFADIALKEAKKLKKDYVLYSDALESFEEYKNNLHWVKKIKEALSEDRVVCFFQPIYENATHKITKYESLVRIIEKDGTVLSPYLFLDIAKQSKLYKEITKRVIEKVFRYINFSDKIVSINITAEDLSSKSTKEFIYNQLKDLKNRNNIIFELVESEGIESFDDAKLFIDTIKDFGCKIAIDDFGTGYSNFEYLLKFEADFIKIDGSLIKNIDTSYNNYSVVEAIVSFAKKNNIEIIAEFVSSQSIQNKVLELGIEFSQGYLISEPKKWEEL